MFTVTLIICASMYAVVATQQMTEEQRAKKAKLAMQEDRESATLAQALFEEARYRAQEVKK
jgi:hypothetical protein